MRQNQKGFSEIVLILIVVVLVGAVGYFVYQNSQLKKDGVVTQSNSDATPETSLPASSLPPKVDESVKYSIIREGSNGTLGIEESAIVIKNSKNLAEIWTKLFESVSPVPDLPVIDFDANYVIYLSSGIHSSGGYSKKVKRLEEKDDKVLITVKNTSLEPGSAAIQSFITQYQFLLISKTLKPIEFITLESNANPFRSINIEPGTVLSSPFTVVGEIERGYMFEGIFSVVLKSEIGKIITSVTAKQTPPSNWTTDDFVKFSADLTFSTSAKSGIIVFDSANPSGLPEHRTSYYIPVKYK